MDEAGVVLEVDVTQLGVAVQPEAFDDQRLELPGQKIGEIEGARCRIGEILKAILAGERGIAVGAREALHPFLLEHPIERAAGAAIGVGDVDSGMGGAGLLDGTAHRVCDQRRPVVQGGGQTAQIEMVQAVRLDEGNDLPGEGATGDDQRALHGLHSRRYGAAGNPSGTAAQTGAGMRSWLCFLAMKAWAVSTATEASRQ
jgi:hypothetical protein